MAVLSLVLLAMISLQSCAGMAPAQQAAVVTGSVGAFGGLVVSLVDALSPYLPPEKVAEIQAIAHSGVDTGAALAKAFGTFADQISQLKAAAAANAAASAGTVTVPGALGTAAATIAAVETVRQIGTAKIKRAKAA